MWRQCESCRVQFNDEHRLTVCPHYGLHGGDAIGLPRRDHNMDEIISGSLIRDDKGRMNPEHMSSEDMLKELVLFSRQVADTIESMAGSGPMAMMKNFRNNPFAQKG